MAQTAEMEGPVAMVQLVGLPAQEERLARAALPWLDWPVQQVQRV